MSRLDLALRVLDHQIVGPEGELLGNVDDLELVERDGGLAVTGLASGPAALSLRLPGRLGTWTGAIWRRLHPDRQPEPVVLAIERVTEVGSAISVDADAARALERSLGLERWLRQYVVSRIPGAKGGGEEDRAGRNNPAAPAGGQGAEDEKAENEKAEDEKAEDEKAEDEKAEEENAGGAAVGPAVPGGDTRAPRPDRRWLSDLIGAPVRDESGRVLGRISEVRAWVTRQEWRVTDLQATRRRLGSRLGYHADRRQGPWLIGRIVRAWHRADVLIPLADVRSLPWAAVGTDRAVLVAADDGLSHPSEESNS